MQIISRVLNRIITKNCGELLILHLTIADNWNCIVGSELAKLTALDSLSRGSGKDCLAINISVIGSASILVQASKVEILERLNDLTCKKRFTKINLKHCLEIERIAQK